MLKAEPKFRDPPALIGRGGGVYQAVEVTVFHLWSWPGRCPVTGPRHQSFLLVWTWPLAWIRVPHLDFDGWNKKKNRISECPAHAVNNSEEQLKDSWSADDDFVGFSLCNNDLMCSVRVYIVLSPGRHTCRHERQLKLRRPGITWSRHMEISRRKQ